MKMTDSKLDDQALEAFFDAARADAPQVPDALMARVLADAAAEQRRPRPRTWMVDLLGGGFGISGLITATCVGFWIGLAPPAGLPDLGGTLLGTAQGDTGDLAYLDFGDGGWMTDLEEELADE
jgi:hypothetical protein